MPRFTNIQRKRLINIKGTICCNCLKDEEENIMFHHIVPISIGGTDNDSNIVPLCQTCHQKLHNIENKDKTLSHGDLIKKGMKKAQQNGVKLGRKPLTENDLPIIFKQKYYPLIKSSQITITKAAQELNMSRTTIYRYVYILDQFNKKN